MSAQTQRILMGPGPSDVPASVLAALARPTIGHLDPKFLELMDEIRDRLRAVFQTRNDMTLAVSGTGSAGMETLFVNLIEPGDKALVCVNGVFGGRMADVASRCGAEVVTIDVPWGTVFDQQQIIDAVVEHEPAVVAVVHAETSTGACQPIDGIANAIHERGGLLLVDCVTSLAGMPVKIDEWGVDAAYSGTQKCLSCPPGLSPVTLSDRAVARIEARNTKVQSWYLDLTLVRNYWGAERVYHHTAPINMLYALHEALGLVLDEGLETRFARHRDMHNRLCAGLSELGIELVAQEGHRLPMLNAVSIPDGVDDKATRAQLLEEWDVEIGGGLGAFSGKAWRIGLMGASANASNIAVLLAALAEILKP